LKSFAISAPNGRFTAPSPTTHDIVIASKQQSSVALAVGILEKQQSFIF